MTNINNRHVYPAEYHRQGDFLVKGIWLACWTCITLIWNTAWEWHPGAETCRRLRLVICCILLSSFFGWWFHIWFSVWYWRHSMCSEHVGSLFPGLGYESYEWKNLRQSAALHLVNWVRCVLVLTTCCRYDFSSLNLVCGSERDAIHSYMSISDTLLKSDFM
jgi:hypothetical protein